VDVETFLGHSSLSSLRLSPQKLWEALVSSTASAELAFCFLRERNSKDGGDAAVERWMMNMMRCDECTKKGSALASEEVEEAGGAAAEASAGELGRSDGVVLKPAFEWAKWIRTP